MLKKLRPYLISVLAALAVGGIAAIIIRGSLPVYDELKKPLLAPPAIVFPVVWSTLYILMGIGAAMVWRSDALFKKSALTLYTVQLAVNFIWPILFFTLGVRLLSFFWLVLLVILVIIMIDKFSKISPRAGWLQLPYFIWLLFAGYLNLYIWYMNK